MTTPAHSDPGADLLQAFLQTEYVVLPGTDAITVGVGKSHQELDHTLNHRSWAVVTAFNPGAIVTDKDTNERQHQTLLAAIADAGLDFRPASNRDPQAQWPDEPSFLIIDAEEDWLVMLTRRLGQLALIAGRPGQAAELWLIDGDWNDELPRYVRQVGA